MRIRKGITMKAKRSIRYISGRIWWIGMAVLLLLLLLTATQAMLFMLRPGHGVECASDGDLRWLLIVSSCFLDQ